ncbi:HAD-IC family P-type ATPase [uncultured Ruthenibacterium sp.]|uniref:HAD-IC family P-type ATPase n=1 Tax=uncultured Ruthenibacterium sp. TaxID=1905347 RepID=UPI00349EA53A
MKHKKAPNSVDVFFADCHTGLNRLQVEQRQNAGLSNTAPASLSKTTGRIIRDNVVTPFNFLFCFLALCLLAVGSYGDILFLGVIFLNTIIGIVQELRVKHELEKISLLHVSTVTVVRGGKYQDLPTEQLVRDDIVYLRAGNQVPADAQICEGTPEVNESLLTGEAVSVQKHLGDELMSGSFLAAGTCLARLTRVGEEAYAAQLVREAKKPSRHRSEMMLSLDKLVRFIGILLIPLGIAMFLKQYLTLHTGLSYAVTSTVAAVIGMVPEGLYLLTSVALALGVLILARRHVLVHELSCIENLARVDVICFDKTGTLTQGTLEVNDVLPVRGTKEEDLLRLAASYLQASSDENTTAQTLRAYLAKWDAENWRRGSEIPFSSSRKFSARCAPDGTWYVLGAPECVLPPQTPEFSQLESALGRGLRVLAFAKTNHAPVHDRVEEAYPIGFFFLSDTLRPDAHETLDYFHRQGVDVKILSGDNAAAVADIARRAGVRNADRWIDASSLSTEDELRKAALEYTVFGRMTPGQKRILIHALQQSGRTVAMTGDGVNDVLALKDADCSIAMATGSDAAQQVSQLVLLDSNFSVMPRIVDEGRRVINNIQRSAALFLIKNIFSFTISLVLLFVAMPYPFVPLQISVFSFFIIGAPGFLLTFEPCYEKAKSHFLRTVLMRALPGGLTCAACILAGMAAGAQLGLSTNQLSSLCTLVIAYTGLLSLGTVCRPFTPLRIIILCLMCIGYSLTIILFGPLIGLVSLPQQTFGVLAGLFVLSSFLFWLLCRLCTFFTTRRRRCPA